MLLQCRQDKQRQNLRSFAWSLQNSEDSTWLPTWLPKCRCCLHTLYMRSTCSSSYLLTSFKILSYHGMGPVFRLLKTITMLITLGFPSIPSWNVHGLLLHGCWYLMSIFSIDCQSGIPLQDMYAQFCTFFFQQCCYFCSCAKSLKWNSATGSGWAWC